MSRFGYDPKSIDAKWQHFWQEHQTFRTPSTLEEMGAKPKLYILDMFPYPSGDGLHVGHPKGYTASDVIARVRRMQGYNVLHPMGWDSFGLPAERAADREKLHPAIVTKRNIDTFRRQLQSIGLSYDWEREVNSSSPDYYKWTQWIFIKLYERGLAYTADVAVNWCEALGTVLSNEEVQDGKYIETGDPVERRLMRQWLLKITAYAERLIEDLDDLDWPESLKEMQRHWIGKSEGATVTFQIQDHKEEFKVFTTRPDTLFGATYCILAPEHPLVEKITTPQQKAAVANYIAAVRNKSELDRTALTQDKSGVFTGQYAVNPVNDKPIPIWIAEYVLMGYGTGAIMGVPAHDERDHEFATKYGLPIIEVVRVEGAKGGELSVQEAAFVEEGIAVNSAFLNDLPTAEAKAKIVAWLEEHGKGIAAVEYRLRDWIFSRQRYWGEPFPIVLFEDGSTATIPVDQLPVVLPKELTNEAVDPSQPPLARAGQDWLMVTLPDGRVGIRETNTMPQWAGSCWYYLRYTDPKNAERPWDPHLEAYWMPVDLYIGGVEHAVLHLLYARFWHKVLYDCGLVSTKEPFQKLFNQGMVLAHSYQDQRGKYYYPRQVEQVGDQWRVEGTGIPLNTQLEKMSKSRLNVFGLDEVTGEYGADTLRLYEIFIAPVSASGPWLMQGIEGVYRFLQRVWRLLVDDKTGALNAKIVELPEESDLALQKLLHKTIKQVTESIESIDKLNTGVSDLMKFNNAAIQADRIPLAIAKKFVLLLSPFAPHIGEELWRILGEQDTITYAPWPTYDPALIVDEVVEMAVQVNGRVRTVIQVSQDATQMEIEELARNHENVIRAIGSQRIAKVILVPGRIVNFIAGS